MVETVSVLLGHSYICLFIHSGHHHHHLTVFKHEGHTKSFLCNFSSPPPVVILLQLNIT